MVKTVIVKGVEYETEDHTFNKTLSEIKIPEGWRLWKAWEVWKLYEDPKLRKKLNLNRCWFFVEQPNKVFGAVAWFYAVSYGAGLSCYWDPYNHYSSLGVRFCREVKK